MLAIKQAIESALANKKHVETLVPSDSKFIKLVIEYHGGNLLIEASFHKCIGDYNRCVSYTRAVRSDFNLDLMASYAADLVTMASE